MRAGDLRRRLLIQRRAVAQDSAGAQLTTWSDVFTVWASIEPVSGTERFLAGAEQAAVTHTITVRWRPELADPLTVAAMRGVYEGRYFNFGPPLSEGERRRQLAIPATEGPNVG